MRKAIPDDLLQKPGVRNFKVQEAPKAVAAVDDPGLPAAMEYIARQRAALIDAQPAAAATDPPAAARVRSSMPAPPLYVREYAAPRPGGTDTPDGDTILWQPVIVLPTEGKTTLQFHLGSAPGGYQVLVAGHTLDGRIGTTKRILPVGKGPSVPTK